MEFIPKQSTGEVADVPFFDDVTSEGGWQGHATNKSLETLKSEVIISISRLGGLVTAFQRGAFQIGAVHREGFQIHYIIEQPDGGLLRGRLDIASLPVKQDRKLIRSLETKKEKSLKMALYMLRNALDGTWFLQQLSPGFAPLLPWMLEARSGKTLTQLWSENVSMGRFLPPPAGSDFVEGEFEEV